VAKECPPIFGRFIVHIDGPSLDANRRDGINRMLVAVRRSEDPTKKVLCREVRWNGPSRVVDRQNHPIPGTNGRAVSWVETDADLVVTMDNQRETVLSPSQHQPTAPRRPRTAKRVPGVETPFGVPRGRR
jgi:hypothetical protein